MPKLIINLRGTSGSGKTTVARTFMGEHPFERLYDKNNKMRGVRVDVESWRYPLFLIGTYPEGIASGGMDTVSDPYRTPASCANLALKAWLQGHVLCEGLMASRAGPAATLPATLIQVAGKDNVRFCFLNTPLEMCLERVKSRRALAGNPRPFDPSSTEETYKNVQSAERRLKEAKLDVRTVSWETAYRDVFSQFGEVDAQADY